VEEGGKAQVGHPILTVETESGSNVVEVEEPAVAGEAKGEESVTSEDSYLEAASVAELEPDPVAPIRCLQRLFLVILRQHRPLFVGLRAKLELISIRFQVHDLVDASQLRT
jgi:hypothetical protein